MWIPCSTVFVASLLGSLHCVGMCGPFAILAASSEKKRHSTLVPAIAYSLGRLTTYALVGFIFGLLGQALNTGSSMLFGVSVTAFQQTASYVAGALMIAVGSIALARQFGWQVPLPNGTRRLQTVLKSQFQRVNRLPRLRKAYSIGALSCLLPCGWLYTFAIVAASTATPLGGATIMICFWAGTVPVMFALVTGSGLLGRSIQRRVPFAMATIVILIGLFTICYRAPIAVGGDATVENQPEKLVEKIQSLDHTTLPCCSDNQ